MSIFSIAALNTGIRNRKQAEINSKQKKEERSWKHFNCTFSSQQVFFRADLYSWPNSSWKRFECAWLLTLLSIHVNENISVVFFEFWLYFHNHYIVLDICNISIKLRHKNAGLIHRFQNYNKWELVEVSIRNVDDVQWLLPSSAGSKFPD